MFYITGDIHGEPFPRLNTENFPEQKALTKDDYVIICGDFGLVWNKDGESKHEKHQLDELESRSFTTLFCDGNHENFDRLNAYPVEMWHGGRVHKIRHSTVPFRPPYHWFQLQTLRSAYDPRFRNSGTAVRK